MITLCYYNINELPDGKIPEYLDLLPPFMNHDIMRYHNASDRKTRLMARLMLKNILEQEGRAQLLLNWQRESGNKPFIQGWESFNISHSGDLVVLAYGSSVLGVDIEKKDAANYSELMTFFHPAEQDYIAGSGDRADSFYEIWTKKEALLKAEGSGIIKGLNHIDCTRDEIMYQSMNWYFHPVAIHPSYACCVCTSAHDENLQLTEFCLEKTEN